MTKMINFRKFAFAALLAVTSLNFAPSLASAQEKAHGNFTLTHEVHWQNAIVPAGDYRFTFDSGGASGMLTLSKLSGARTGFMLMVHDTDESRATDTNRLLLEATSEGSYVSAMHLPEFGITLNFAVPAQAVAIARTAPAATTTMASAK